MCTQRSKIPMSTWRYEDKGERWSSRVYRDLMELGFGKQASCKQALCTKMKERLELHRMHCPASKLPQGGEKGTSSKPPAKSSDQSSSTIRKSVAVTTRRNSPLSKISKIHSTQTNVTFADFTPSFNNCDHYNVHSAQTNLTLLDDLNPVVNKQRNLPEKKENRLQDNIPVKLTETNEAEDNKREEDIIPIQATETQVLPGRSLYRDVLNKEIQDFFHDIPVFPNTSETVKLKRLNIINNFVYNIADLYIFVDNVDYYDKVKHEIYECLRNLPMWQPQLERDSKGYRDCLIDSLFKFIKTFNEIWRNNKDMRLLKKYPKRFVPYNNCGKNNLEEEISNWVEMNVHNSNKKQFITNMLLKKIKPLLEVGVNEKHFMKEEIFRVLEELSPCMDLSRNKELCVNILASDLTNRLSGSEDKYYFNDIYNHKDTAEHAKWRDKIENETISQITDILFSNDDLALHPNRHDVVKNIRSVLKSSTEFTDSEVSSLANNLATNLRDYFHDNLYLKLDDQGHSSSFIVLTSEHDLSTTSGPKFHSTRISDKQHKEISKLNQADKIFIEQVSAIIRSWLDTTDFTFDTMEDQMYKETIVDDIAYEVHGIVKKSLQSEEPKAKIDEQQLNKVIMKVIMKYGLFKTQVTEKSPQVIDLRQRIMALNNENILNRSRLLEPQHGNRQAMANIKYSNMNDSTNGPIFYQPKALDVLEDNISVWMNEQPSEIYNINDKSTRNKLLREIAATVQDKMTNKKPDNEIKNELLKWLHKIVKPEIKNVDGLAENLKDKIIKLPQDETLTRALHKRLINRINPPFKFESREDSYKNEADEQLNEYINKYIQHNYNEDDDVINGVLKLMLKHELYRLDPSVREALYDNHINDEFKTDKFQMELDIVMVVYGWLKDIPFYYSTLKPGSQVIEFIYTLSKNIADIETERLNHPDRMDYGAWLRTEIATFVTQNEKPYRNDFERQDKIAKSIEDLCVRIYNLRWNEKSDDPLSQAINDYINKHESKDHMKKVLWKRRCIARLRKLYEDQAGAVSSADVKNTLKTVPMPQDESVIDFLAERKYNVRIHDWLQGLPLVPCKTDEEEHARENRMQELLHKVMEYTQRMGGKRKDKELDDDFSNYLNYWLAHLPFQTGHELKMPELQREFKLLLDYVRWVEIQPNRAPDVHVQNISRSKPASERHSKSHNSTQKDPGEQMVEVIEDWCNNLPIKEDNEEVIKATKEQVATNIFQIVGSHIDDPRIANDNEKLRSVLDREIENELQNLSEHQGIEENKESLKASLLDNVMEIKNTIREITAGDDYVHALENSIDEALSNIPHRSSKNDPVYELFKKRFAMSWLLENYDYAVDFHSLKYKKMLSEEMGLWLEEVKARTPYPDKGDMLNDIATIMYKALPPNEDAIIDEIEKIKLRCEIETWANELPLKEAADYNTLLERDQILTILTKILFDIERSEEPDADDKMRMEIIKWANKLPVLPGEKNNLSRYADLLMCFLKASSDPRKCQREPEPKNVAVVEKTLAKLKSGEDLGVPKVNQERTSEVAGPSSSANNKDDGVSGAQLAFLITETIYTWCTQLPLQYTNAEEQNAVQNLKVLIFHSLQRFVGELHSRPNTLRNEGLYEYYLNNQLDAILAQLTNDRFYWEAQQGRNDRKLHLINALKAIRPLVQDLIDREQYKEQLKHTISSFHESMAADVELSNNAQQAILDNFIEYQIHKGDFENQELCKLKIKETLNNELNEDVVDPLLAANRLICELSKVEPPRQYKAHTGRRYSQPSPLEPFIRLPSTKASGRRHSFPYPSQHICPRIAPTPSQLLSLPPLQLNTINMSNPGLSSQRPHSRTPLSTSIDLPSRAFPTSVPQIPPVPIALRSPLYGPQHLPPSSSLSASFSGRASVPCTPPVPIALRSPLYGPQIIPPPSPFATSFPGRPSVPRTPPVPILIGPQNLPPRSPFPAYEIRPFPPPPVYDLSESIAYQPPIPHTSQVIPQNQHYRQPDQAELVEPALVEPRSRNEHLSAPVVAGSRTTAQVRNSPRSLTECPEEQRGRPRTRRPADGRDYCETCEIDEECARFMRPYRQRYMYF